MKRNLFPAFVLIAAFAGAACADDRAYPYVDRPVDFALRFSQHDFDFDYGTSRVDTSVERIGVSWRERFGERLQLGLIGGYSWLTQRNNAPTAGRELNGYHAGFSLDLELLRVADIDAFVNALYIYQRVDADDGSQRVVIATREPEARVGAGYTFANRVRAYGGLRAGRIEGEQRLSGTLNETRAIDETRKTGGFAGVELKLENDGYVGATAETGADRRVALYFGRRF
jgi:hypothetical protein